MRFPKEVAAELERREVANTSNLVRRLQGLRPYPIRVPLHRPCEREILRDVARYESFLAGWERLGHQRLIEYVEVSYKGGTYGKRVPDCLVLGSLEDLLLMVQPALAAQVRETLGRIGELAATLGLADPGPLYPLYRMLEPSALGAGEFSDLKLLLPQLSPGMGRGLYLRALPLEGIDTKYVEGHEKLIYGVLRAAGWIPDSAPNLGGYLGITPKPSGFVYLRRLDPALASPYALAKVSVDDLARQEPPGRRLLVVENEQSGFAIGSYPQSTVIFGCGNDLAWARNAWMGNKERILYWGDLDSWGFFMLAQFRASCAQCGARVDSVMMDLALLQMPEHQARLVRDNVAQPAIDEGSLTEGELAALHYLMERPDGRNRLEQEKISGRVIEQRLDMLLL
ncbi:MAG: hypothetical protein K6A65_03375 [Succinivibrionaceae bacterium]|nr:hypothetical protein [Succinivibrionaceae bacterium]